MISETFVKKFKFHMAFLLNVVIIPLPLVNCLLSHHFVLQGSNAIDIYPANVPVRLNLERYCVRYITLEIFVTFSPMRTANHC